MQFEIGQVVRSKAGHDRDEYLLVTGFDGQFVLLCDGRQRPLDRPKRKNPRHLAATNIKLKAQATQTDRSVRKALTALQNGHAQGE
ncbi:MAG: KOW domain-containing RNA-binding protein [Clostridia bacterium]|nr:KOW domain-containing RNA-binding protein [Clostridia bacterium]